MSIAINAQPWRGRCQPKEDGGFDLRRVIHPLCVFWMSSPLRTEELFYPPIKRAEHDFMEDIQAPGRWTVNIQNPRFRIGRQCNKLRESIASCVDRPGTLGLEYHACRHSSLLWVLGFTDMLKSTHSMGKTKDPTYLPYNIPDSKAMPQGKGSFAHC